MSAAVISGVERQFVLEALQKGLRADGRSAIETRKVRFEFERSDSQAVAHVQLGRTRYCSRASLHACHGLGVSRCACSRSVMCVTTATIIPPFPDRPAEGFIQFAAEFSRMAAEEFEVRAQAAGVHDALASHRSGVPTSAGRLDARRLLLWSWGGLLSGHSRTAAPLTQRHCASWLARRCVGHVGLSFPVCVRGTEPRCCLQVWSLRCAIHVLDHGGNLIDASSVAAVASLLHFRRPDVSVSGETVTVHSVADRAPVPLSIHHIPVCVTFAIFDGVRVSAWRGVATCATGEGYLTCWLTFDPADVAGGHSSG